MNIENIMKNVNGDESQKFIREYRGTIYTMDESIRSKMKNIKFVFCVLYPSYREDYMSNYISSTTLALVTIDGQILFVETKDTNKFVLLKYNSKTYSRENINNLEIKINNNYRVEKLVNNLNVFMRKNIEGYESKKKLIKKVSDDFYVCVEHNYFNRKCNWEKTNPMSEIFNDIICVIEITANN